MNFEYSEEEQLLADAAARFCTAADPAADHWAEMAEMGWFGVALGEDDGGFGLGMAGAAILAEACGNAALADPILGHAVLASAALRGSDLDDLRDQAVAGEIRLGVALAEAGARHDVSCICATATSQSDGYCLTGQKAPAPGGMGADHLVIAAMLDGTETLFLVPADADGVQVASANGADARDLARIALTDAKAVKKLSVSPDALQTRLFCLLAADSCGAMRRLVDMTRDYLETRKQFGRPIGSFQALQHRFADLHVALDEARSLMLAAAMAVDANAPEAPRLARMAWVQASWSARRVAEEAVQMHGAIGITEEFPVGRYVRRLTVNESLAGHADLHLALLADTADGYEN